MSAIDTTFQQLRSSGRKALIPFIAAGDPDLETTVEAIKLLDASGANIIELGIPYSDPIADGPVIQAAYTRALAGHVTLADIFAAIEPVASQIAVPLVTMVSYATVYRHGLAQYVADAKAAGFAGAIVPDLLFEESDELGAISKDADFSLIQLVTPTTTRDRAVNIAKASTGFLYYVSVAGITGTRDALPDDLVENVAWLREQTAVPVSIGFGISRPEHAQTLAPVADGIIVGSAIVRHFESIASRGREAAFGDIRALVAGLRQGLDDASS
ncbi:MAG: tryptophan synthase subunit alpha [Pirellulales bacterium]|nr:tryptophan synthase subunit alpha [Pirellulales bacterium]